MMCKDEKAVTLAAFLEELKKAVPNVSPRFFMLDNCGAEIKGVLEVFPQTRILLCIFHVIQVCFYFLGTLEFSEVQIAEAKSSSEILLVCTKCQCFFLGVETMGQSAFAKGGERG